MTIGEAEARIVALESKLRLLQLAHRGTVAVPAGLLTGPDPDAVLVDDGSGSLRIETARLTYTLGLYGDSITAGTGGAGVTPANCYGAVLGQLLGNTTVYNRGIGGCTVVQNASGTLPQTVQALENPARIQDVASIPEALTDLIAWGGTNDITGGASLAAFGASCQAMIGRLLGCASVGPRCRVWVPGILPRFDLSPAALLQWTIRQQAAALAAGDARVRFVDTSSWAVECAPLNVHPTPAGHRMIAARLLRLLRG